MKIEKKRCVTENFDSWIANICRDTFFGFTKKNKKGKEKSSISRRGSIKGGCTTFLCGGMTIIHRIRRSKLKVVLVVEVGGN
jgi:hypothetical protein